MKLLRASASSSRRPTAGQRRALLALLGSGLPGLARAWSWGEPDATICGQASWPAFPAANQPPLIQNWFRGVKPSSPAPDCTGLTLQKPELLVRLVGICHRHSQLADELLRFGQASRLQGMQYWSFSEQRRVVLVPHAHAVSDATGREARASYSLDELRSGRWLYFVHDDNRSGQMVVYRMQLQRQDEHGFEMRFENSGELSMMGLTLLAPAELQWLVSVQDLGRGLWGYRSLLGLRRLRMGLARQHRLSNLSRAAAMFDLWAGSQTDLEPWRAT